MNTYLIINPNCANDFHIIKMDTSPRHWVINHLDMSITWQIILIDDMKNFVDRINTYKI